MNQQEKNTWTMWACTIAWEKQNNTFSPLELNIRERKKFKKNSTRRWKPKPNATLPLILVHETIEIKTLRWKELSSSGDWWSDFRARILLISSWSQPLPELRLLLSLLWPDWSLSSCKSFLISFSLKPHWKRAVWQNKMAKHTKDVEHYMNISTS